MMRGLAVVDQERHRNAPELGIAVEKLIDGGLWRPASRHLPIDQLSSARCNLLDRETPRPDLRWTMSSRHRVLEHTADIGFEARAHTLPELFAESARALIDIAFEDDAVQARDTYAIEATGDDLPSCVVNFLEELLYVFDTGRFVPADIQVDEATEARVSARLIGEPRDQGRHRWKVIVKAVTYHHLEVRRHDDEWSSRVFLDV
jgi:SHS2 domain-containing protein